MDSGSLLELSCFEMRKLEANLEVSILELYYSTKSHFCEYEKGSVCGIVALGALFVCLQIVDKQT